MKVYSAELPSGLRRRSTDWGLVLSPGEASVPETRRARLFRRFLGAASMLLAGLAMGVPMDLADLSWARPLAAGSLALIGAVLLWPRRQEVLLEIEVDLQAGEIRVVELRGEVRTVVSRQPVGAAGALEIGRTVVPLPKLGDSAPGPDAAGRAVSAMAR